VTPDTWATHLERHAALCRRWGRPETVRDTAAALRTLGIADVSPDDAVAFLYSSAEAAQAFAASNLEHYGYRSFGPVVADAGVLGAVYVPMRPLLLPESAGAGVLASNRLSDRGARGALRLVCRRTAGCPRHPIRPTTA
jgi:hypothetical protein